MTDLLIISWLSCGVNARSTECGTPTTGTIRLKPPVGDRHYNIQPSAVYDHYHCIHTLAMTAINTKFALRSASGILSRPPSAACFLPARHLHVSAPTLKDPPLKGPVPTEQAEEVKEGGDGFLGVCCVELD